MNDAIKRLYETREKFYRALQKCNDEDLVAFTQYIMHPNYKGRHLLSAELDILIKEVRTRKLRVTVDFKQYMKAREERRLMLTGKYGS